MRNNKKQFKPSDKEVKSPQNKAFEDDEQDDPMIPKKDSKKKNSSTTPTLDNFGKDLTKMASEGKLDAIIGRDKEVDRIAQILCRRKKNNPIILGDPGCVDENTLITIRKVSNSCNHEIVIVE